MPINASRLKPLLRSDQVVHKHLDIYGATLQAAKDDVSSRAMLTINVGGDRLHVVYRDHAANTIARDVPVNERTPKAVLAELLSSVVSSWDLLDDDGSPWPIDRYALEGLSKDALMALYGAILAVESGTEGTEEQAASVA